MVVILLLTPPYTQSDGCDGGTGSNGSSTSTGDTAIPAYIYQKQQQNEDNKSDEEPTLQYYIYANSSQFENGNRFTTNAYNGRCYCQCCQQQQALEQVPQAPPILPKTQPTYETYFDWTANTVGGQSSRLQSDKSFLCAKDQWSHAAGNNDQTTYTQQKQQQQQQQQKQQKKKQHEHKLPEEQVDNERLSAFSPPSNIIRPMPQRFQAYFTTNNNNNRNNYKNNKKNKININNTNRNTSTSYYVRHVTRVNFYDVDTSQIEFESKDNNNDDNEQQLDTEAITKEEEWITKRKTELTTTRQIETRVKRQVVLEDGKVVEDSGPIVSTNTTEDTDKQETETTEKRDLGLPQVEARPKYSDALTNEPAKNEKIVAEFDDGAGGKVIKKMVARPVDGLVRETNEKRVISHEEVKDYLETEAIQHYGDFADETYVQAVKSGAENLEDVLLSKASKQQLATVGPRIVKQTTNSRKTIDSENTQKRCLAQEDGTLVTENKTTTEHEIIADGDVPEDKLSKSLTKGNQDKEIVRESKQRYFKQRDEQNVDLVLDGKVIDTEMRYAAETAQMEKEGSLERPDDWDSLSDRMRKMRNRTHQKTLMQQHKAALLADRKDALTKRPLDFDREEETRKGETIKWLESHFGSESTASNDSREDVEAELEPTKKTYFNVTIKSNSQQPITSNVAATAPLTNGHKTHMTHTIERKYANEHHKTGNTNNANNGNKYYQGISNWADRKEAPIPPPAPAKTTTTKHFSSKAFRDDLQETVERNRLRRTNAYNGSRERLAADPKDSYVSREDILQQKRQSLTAQYLARQRRGSREQLDEPDTAPLSRPTINHAHNLNGSRTDLRFGKPEPVRPVYKRANTMDLNGLGARQSPVHINTTTTTRQHDYVDSRAKSYDRELNDHVHYESRTLKHVRRSPTPESVPHLSQSSTLGRPSVPQRRRAIEKKLRQQQSSSTPLKVQLDVERGLTEPPPDYSPPPRSRSSSPEYVRGRVKDYRDIESSTMQRKQQQRTRFAPAAPQQQPARQSMATQTTQIAPSNISTSTVTSQKSTRRVSQVIGNSLRKLVSKIRSASAERKMRRKSKSKSREQSPIAPALEGRDSNGTMPTYQQYNVIDSHIVGQTGTGSNESERESIQPESTVKMERESAPPSYQHNKRGESAESDREHTTNPRQRYYLGEDPYSSTLYGKENLYDSEAKRQRETRSQLNETSEVQRESRRDEIDYQQHRGPSTHTLGRYQKSTNRFAGSTPNLSHEYRTTQTLPRKLHEPQSSHYQYQKRQQMPATGYTTLGHPERRTAYQSTQTSGKQPITNTGPAKPARSYAKALNRSRSFSVHGINGTSDPSPAYVEKINRNNYNNNNQSNNNNSNLQASQAYKSNPHLFAGSNVSGKETNMLKSPSIVNLISRSQRDLSKIGGPHEDERERVDEKREIYHPTTYYKSVSQDRADEYTRKPSQYQLRAKHSLPVELNKDTASIIRRENEYNMHRNNNTKIHEKRSVLTSYRDEHKRRGSGATIIDIRHK